VSAVVVATFRRSGRTVAHVLAGGLEVRVPVDESMQDVRAGDPVGLVIGHDAAVALSG
jgi:prophage tail gpP-like protein